MITDGPNSSSATLDELRRENERLRASVQQSSRELELLRAERVELLDQIKQKDREFESVQHQLQALLRRYYGRSSEKMDPNQRLLFEDLIDKAIPKLPAADPDEEESPPTRRRKGHGRRRLPADLPREKVIHDLPEDEKPCPCCGTLRHIIGKQTHEQLDYVPAKVKVIEHIRLTYGCPRCEQDASPDGPQIATADKPLQPIEKGLAAPGLLSYVIVSKYGDHRVRGEAVSEMRGGLSWPGDRTRPQTSPNCGGQEPLWEASGAKGAAGSHQVGSAKSNASEPSMTCRNRISLTSKPGSGGCPGTSTGGACSWPVRRPAQRRRERRSGSDMEPRNLSPRCQGRNPSGDPARVRVPMRGTGAERPVVARRDV